MCVGTKSSPDIDAPEGTDLPEEDAALPAIEDGSTRLNQADVKAYQRTEGNRAASAKRIQALKSFSRKRFPLEKGLEMIAELLETTPDEIRTTWGRLREVLAGHSEDLLRIGLTYRELNSVTGPVIKMTIYTVDRPGEEAKPLSQADIGHIYIDLYNDNKISAGAQGAISPEAPNDPAPCRPNRHCS